MRTLESSYQGTFYALMCVFLIINIQLTSKS